MDLPIYTVKAKLNNGSGIWITGFYIRKSNGECTVCNDEDEIMHYFNIDPNTISRFTGLYDMNGQPIFENDIVLTQEYWTRPYSDKRKGKRLYGYVTYKIRTGKFYNKETKQFDKICAEGAEWSIVTNHNERRKYSYGINGDFFDCAVIGNIFDNRDIYETICNQ